MTEEELQLVRDDAILFLRDELVLQKGMWDLLDQRALSSDDLIANHFFEDITMY